MRTLAADWVLPRQPNTRSGSWFSNVGASIQRVVGSARPARQPSREGQGSRDAFVQADVAAFISAFMRIG
jgi:hypothetical protein